MYGTCLMFYIYILFYNYIKHFFGKSFDTMQHIFQRIVLNQDM